MKNILKSFLMLSIMLTSFSGFAYDFVIFGHVADEDGNSIPNQQIFFRTGNNPLDSLFTFETYTDEYGDYSISLDGEDSLYVQVETYAYWCNQYYSETVYVGGPGQKEVNFVICSDNPQSNCDIFFYYQYYPENLKLIHFFPVYEDSINETSYNWDFGDGNSSDEKYPVHLYESSGNYLVTLTAYNQLCGEMTDQNIVYVPEDTVNYGICYADFDFFFDSIDHQKVYFYDESYSEIGITSWYWDFGDGTNSSEENPVHVYAEDVDYSVILTIESADVCSDSHTKYIWVGDSTWYPDECQALFFAQYDYYDFFTVHFIDMSWGGNDPTGGNEILAWQWDFGDGTGSAEQNPSHTYAEEGEFLVSLMIYTENCQSVFQEMVYIIDWENPPGDCQAFFYPEFDSLATAVQFYDLSIPEPNFWHWEFGDGETSQEQNPYHIYPQTGIYLVSLTSGADSCTSTFMMEIELFENADKSKNTTYSGIIRRAFAVNGGGSLGLDDPYSETEQFMLYPNPVNDFLIIDFKKHVSDSQIELINLAGQTVTVINSGNSDKAEINTSDLPPGIYLVKIITQGKTEVLKFIK